MRGAEVEEVVVRNGGTTDTRKPGKIFMEVKNRNRISQKPSASFYWKRNPETDWPCTTWEGCWQMVRGGRSILPVHRNGMPRRWRRF